MTTIEIFSGQGSILPSVSDEVRAMIIADLEGEITDLRTRARKAGA